MDNSKTDSDSKNKTIYEEQVGEVKDVPEAAEQTKAPPLGAIPEEYLTDEDLYPTQEETSKNAILTNKKKPLVFLVIGGVTLIVFIVMLLLKLLGAGSGKPAENVKLVFWGLWQDEVIVNEMIKEYQATNPSIEIEYVLMDAKDNYKERVVERIRNGTGPDIFRFHNTWVPMIKEILSVSPNTVYTVEDFKNTFYPVTEKDLTVNGQIVGIPHYIDGLVMLYNKDIIKALGVETPPTTWEELIDIAEKATVYDENKNIITAGVALGTAENISHFSDILALMFLQNNVDINNFETDPNAEAVFDTYTGFAISANPVWSAAMDNSVESFASERVAIILTPVYEIDVIRHLNPDLNFGVSQVPQIQGGESKNIANYWADGVSRGSKNQQAAWDFLKFLSSKESLEKMYQLEVKNGRSYGNPYSRKDMAELLVQHEYLGAITKDANSLDSLPLISRTYDNGLNDKLINYMKDAINSIFLSTGTKEALRNMSQGFSQVFTQYPN